MGTRRHSQTRSTMQLALKVAFPCTEHVTLTPPIRGAVTLLSVKLLLVLPTPLNRDAKARLGVVHAPFASQLPIVMLLPLDEVSRLQTMMSLASKRSQIMTDTLVGIVLTSIVPSVLQPGSVMDRTVMDREVVC